MPNVRQSTGRVPWLASLHAHEGGEVQWLLCGRVLVTAGPLPPSIPRLKHTKILEVAGVSPFGERR